MNWLQQKQFGNNTIGGFIKNVKVFMNEAVARGLTKSQDYKSRKFKTIEESAETIYLSEEELLRIYNLDFPQNSKLEKVRDLFIIACFTGLRFSDLMQLEKIKVSENRSLIKIKTEKTGEVVVIPINKYIKSILERNNNNFPKSISNQKMNAYLKEISQLAELNEDVVVNSSRGGERVSSTFKKWELVSVHTARRSFATNAYLKDVPTISIMKITGHRTERNFLKYIKISQEDNAAKLANHPFFE